MAMVRNASNQPLTLYFEGAEFRFSPQDEHELTDVQLASEEFKKSEEYFVVSPSASNIQEADPKLTQELVIQEEITAKTDSKRK